MDINFGGFDGCGVDGINNIWLRRQHAVAVYSRDHVRLWDGRFSWCYNCTPEGQWSVGSVLHENAAPEWQWPPFDHCLDDNSFDAGEYSIWNNTLWYFAHWFFDGGNASGDYGNHYSSCGKEIYNDGTSDSIAVRPTWLAAGQWLTPYLTAGGMARYSADGRL